MVEGSQHLWQLSEAELPHRGRTFWRQPPDALGLPDGGAARCRARGHPPLRAAQAYIRGSVQFDLAVLNEVNDLARAANRLSR